MSKAIFTDKDGVLNDIILKGDGTYRGPYTMDETKFLPCIKQGVEKAHAAGYKVFVVSNQPQEEWPSPEVQNDFLAHLSSVLDYTFGFDGWMFAKNRKDRFYKPNIGMIADFVSAHDIDVSKSWMVGDRWRDAQLAENALLRFVWVPSGEDLRGAPYLYQVSGFHEAVDKIIEHDRRKDVIKEAFKYGSFENIPPTP